MFELKQLRITGVITGIFATLVGAGELGFYIWKAVEVSQCSDAGNTTATDEYDPCFDERNSSDVCYYEELEVRSYVGIAEGIVGLATGIILVIAFNRILVPFIWVWVVWALGIASYNAYCVYDYLTTIRDNTAGCIDDSEFWSLFTEQDYAHFYIMATTTLCGYGLSFCIIIPVGALITKMVGSMSSSTGSYELQARKNS